MLWELVAVSVVAAVVGWLDVEDGAVEEDVEDARPLLVLDSLTLL